MHVENCEKQTCNKCKQCHTICNAWKLQGNKEAISNVKQFKMFLCCVNISNAFYDVTSRALFLDEFYCLSLFRKLWKFFREYWKKLCAQFQIPNKCKKSPFNFEAKMNGLSLVLHILRKVKKRKLSQFAWQNCIYFTQFLFGRV